MAVGVKRKELILKLFQDFREMQIKITKNYHHIPTRMAIMKKDNYQLNAHTLLVGKQNCISTLENSLAVSDHIKHIPTIRPSYPFPKCVSEKNKNVHAKSCM